VGPLDRCRGSRGGGRYRGGGRCRRTSRLVDCGPSSDPSVSRPSSRVPRPVGPWSLGRTRDGAGDRRYGAAAAVGGRAWLCGSPADRAGGRRARRPCGAVGRSSSPAHAPTDPPCPSAQRSRSARRSSPRTGQRGLPARQQPIPPLVAQRLGDLELPTHIPYAAVTSNAGKQDLGPLLRTEPPARPHHAHTPPGSASSGTRNGWRRLSPETLALLAPTTVPQPPAPAELSLWEGQH
jgi:hypothetical protein